MEDVDGVWRISFRNVNHVENGDLIAGFELVGFDAFDGLGGGVPDHGVVVGGHGDGASGVGCDCEPVVAGAFDPMFDGLEDGVTGGGVDTDGSPVSKGIINGKGPKVIDNLGWGSLF